MLSLGIVSCGYPDKKEYKKLAQRIKTVTRRIDTVTHTVSYNIIEATDYALNTKCEKEDWEQIISQQDGFIFLIPEPNKNSETILTQSLDVCSHHLANKPALIIVYGVKHNSLSYKKSVEHIRSFEMPVLFNSVVIPYLDPTKASAFDLFLKIETDILSEVKKLINWTIGMKYTRDLIQHQGNGASSSS